MNRMDAASPTTAWPFELLYQDEALLLLNKPAGLLAVPGRGADKQDCLSARVQAVFPQARTVHRLDMSTSGVMLMALGPAMQRAVQRQFEQRIISKGYIAVVAGRLQPECGEVDLPLINDWPNRPRQIVDPQRGKPALTRYRVLDYDARADTSRVQLEPITGRTHQLRVHMQALGHAILGDPLYAPVAAQARVSRLLLHAESICLEHPLRRQKVCYHCPAPF